MLGTGVVDAVEAMRCEGSPQVERTEKRACTLVGSLFFRVTGRHPEAEAYKADEAA